jgi:hypothetical protein
VGVQEHGIRLVVRLPKEIRADSRRLLQSWRGTLTSPWPSPLPRRERRGKTGGRCARFWEAVVCIAIFWSEFGTLWKGSLPTGVGALSVPVKRRVQIGLCGSQMERNARPHPSPLPQERESSRRALYFGGPWYGRRVAGGRRKLSTAFHSVPDSILSSAEIE